MSNVIANVEGNVVDKFEYKIDNLKTFADSAQGLKDIGIIKSRVSADIEGNVIDKFEYKIDNLKTFADSAKDLGKIGVVKSQVAANIEGNVTDKFEFEIDNLKAFSENAKGLKNIGSFDSKVTANIEGNVVDTFEFKIDNLKKFSDSAKDLKDLGSFESKVKANIEGNVTDKFEFEIDNLKKFSDSAEGLKDIGQIESHVKANIEGNVVDTFEFKIDNLKKFTDSAQDLENIGDVESNVEANVKGNVVDTFEFKIDNLKKFSDSAEGLKDLGDIESTVKANVKGNVIDTFEFKIDNLKIFVDSAKGLKDIGNIESTVKANVKGNVIDKFEFKIDNLKKFAESAEGLKDLGNIKSNVKANIDGNVIDKFEHKIDNLKVFSDSAKGLSNLEKNMKRNVEANIDGNVINASEDNLENLKAFAKSAKTLQDVESSDVTVSVSLKGNLGDNNNIENLVEFAKGAKELQGIESNEVTITATLDGNITDDEIVYKINNLKTFADGAKVLQGIESIESNIKANVEGTVLDTKEFKINNLKTFAESAKGLKDVESVDITIKADIEGDITDYTNSKIENLKVFAESAESLQDVKSSDITVKANLESNLLEWKGTLGYLAQFAESAAELDDVASSDVTVNASVTGDLNDTIITQLEDFSAIVTTLSSVTSPTISVKIDIDSVAIDNAVALLEKVANSGLFKDYSASVQIKADDTLVTSAIQNINNTTLADKTLKISEKGSKTVLDALTKINNKKLNNKTVKVNYVKGTMPSIPPWPGGSDGNKNSPWPLVNGTAHVKGTAWAGGTAYKGGNWGAPRTETALTGELGPELLIRDGRWTTIGENGAEFTQVKKGDIIFNHRQTEELFRNGYVTSGGGRGKAYAEGTAYAGGKSKRKTYTFEYSDSSSTSSSSGSVNTKKSSDYSKDFEEVFDWFEVRMEEIHEDLDLMAAKLENAITLSSKNNILDSMIATNKTQLTTLEKGIKLYDEYANTLLSKVPKAYRDEAKDGKIAIEEFAGAADEKTLEAINNYREWAQKVADLKVQLQEVQKEIEDLAKQKFDNVYESYDVKANIERKQNEKLESAIDYDEESGYITSEKYYKEMMKNTEQQAKYLTTARNEMQKTLDAEVKAGNIKKYSDAWYEMVEQMYDIDLAIDECTLELEEFQNAINDIYWDNFDELTERLENISDEVDSLIGLMEDIEDPVITPKTDDGWSADEVEWSDEGMVQLGLYAQKMEVAEYQAKQYAEAIDELNKQYAEGRYSESEYLEKLDELKDGQYDSIDAYYEAREAIVELNEARVDSIKEGIEKEIEAYEELIDKKQEELDAEKDLYDFQKSVMEQQKDISDIERQIAALSGDNSASARAKRKQLEAELAEAKAGLEETYYERSLEDKQTGLDKELESFQEEKEAEIEKWEKYLEDVKLVIADTLAIVQGNAFDIYDTLQERAQEYNLTLSDALLNPWKDGQLAVDQYADNFGDAISSTTDELSKLESGWQSAIDTMDKAADVEIGTQNKENNAYSAAEKYVPPPPEPAPTPTPSPDSSSSSSSSGKIKVGGKINARGAKIYDYAGDKSGETQYYKKDPIYTVLAEKNGYLKVRYHKLSRGVTGWFKKGDVKAYAKGSKKINEDQLALINELGPELVLHAGKNGNLEYLTAGSGVVPADLTSNLMEWGELNPQDILDRNRPSVGVSPEVHATEINLNIQYGDMLKIENFKGDNPDEIAKIVAKQFEKHTKDLNNALRKYTR